MPDIKETDIDEYGFKKIFDPYFMKPPYGENAAQRSLGTESITPGSVLGGAYNTGKDILDWLIKTYVYDPTRESSWPSQVSDDPFIVNSTGERVDQYGDLIKPIPNAKPPMPTPTPIPNAKPPMPTPTPLTNTIIPKLVQGGFQRAMQTPSALVTDIEIHSPEEQKFVEDRDAYYSKFGVSPDAYYPIIQGELAMWRENNKGVGAQPQEEQAFQTWYKGWADKLGINPNPDDPNHFYDYRAAFKAGVEPDPITKHWPSTFKKEGHPNLIVDGVNTKTGEPVSPQTWTPRQPTDFASQYEKTSEAGIPKWSDLPQMIGLPEYREPDYGGTLGQILRGLVYGGGMGAIGRDPVKADQERAALAKSEIEKRRTEMRSDITAQREFISQRAQVVTNAKLKAIEMRKSAEDKSVADELALYQMAVEADPQAINKLVPRIAQLRGVKPESIQNLYDKATGKWKIARTPEEIEGDKTRAAIAVRTQIAKEFGPALGMTDPRDIAKFQLKGEFPEEDVLKILNRKLVDAYKSKNEPEYKRIQGLIKDYKVSNDEELVRSGYRFQEAMKNLGALRGQVSDELYEALEGAVFSTHWTGKMLPSMPRLGGGLGATVGKMNPIYRKAEDALDPEHPEKRVEFTLNHGKSPEEAIYLFDKNVMKGKLPSTAVALALEDLPLDNITRSERVNQLLDEEAFPNKGTPLTNQLRVRAEASIRSIYGTFIRKIEEAEGVRMPPEAVARFYDSVQNYGLDYVMSQFATPKKKK